MPRTDKVVLKTGAGLNPAKGGR